jgi:uncharacterized membrane protein YfcA
LSVLAFTALVALGSFAAGLLGALTGLGGGVVIVPLLVVAFGIDLPYAIGASLVAVIASSSGSASAYVREGYSNVRIAMLLEIATTVGALAGAALVALEVIPAGALSVTFGVVLAASALAGLGEPPAEGDGAPPDPLARRLGLDGEYPTPEGPCPYRVRRVPAGFALMFLAGALSGLLGIGSGALKVLAMDRVMAIPFKVSTTTSNFMIGVTAAASAGVYLHRGYIEPAVAFPVMLGVLAGALVGARVLAVANVRWLRLLFTAVVVVMAAQMLYKGILGRV